MLVTVYIYHKADYGDFLKRVPRLSFLYLTWFLQNKENFTFSTTIQVPENWELSESRAIVRGSLIIFPVNYFVKQCLHVTSANLK